MRRSFRRCCPSLFIASLLAMLVLLAACAGQQSRSASEDIAAKANPEKQFANETALNKRYANLVIAEFAAPEEIRRDYPDDLKACREAAVTALVQSGKYRSVSVLESAAKNEPTLVVATNVPQMRIVGFSARFWGGAFAGNSERWFPVFLPDRRWFKSLSREIFHSPWSAM